MNLVISILVNYWVFMVIGVILVIFFCIAVSKLYRVVPINEAHIRVLMQSRGYFSARSGKTAYWYIPFLTKLHKLPLCNLAIPVNDIKLNDRNMAKFVCDLMCFININNIELAVERLSLTDTETELGFDFVKLSEDLRAIMESIGRTVTTKQTILDIYMDRQMLDTAITKEVELVFPKWGIQLVDLELKDIKDAPDSTIIHDIERKIAAEINRDAEIKVAITNRESEIAKAENEEAYRKRQIEKDRQVGIYEQEKNKLVAESQREANVQQVEANRVMLVGTAENDKQKVMVEAEAKKQKLTIEAEGEANQINKKGEANAHIVQISKEAEAAGTSKLAGAMKEFDETAIGVKFLDVQQTVLLSKFNALAAAISKANIQWIISGEGAQKFFGLNLDAVGGANLKQFIEESELDISSLARLLKKEQV